MPSKYTDDQQGALEDITEAGGRFTITHTPATVPDDTRPWRKEPGVPEDAVVWGVLVKYRVTMESQGFTAGSEDAKSVLPGDQELLVAAIDPGLTFMPMPRDTIVGPDGQQYVILTRRDVAPDGIAILHRLHVRK